ncbi:unnamed protein product [Euphydryas editha]|uniref:Uncharacterized protein n=1 Tax=Euphydryas editha TaxID=104508 RepID=A0AAU9UMS3_EUPED|nr:unnamed protein product [Euphydryas editha]CAH2100454.1 unnamed protein product [Euphydryas editha]CAH2100455.1 unnamed protein product [Euphydryas editha]
MSASARRCARMRCVLTSLTASETRLQSRAVGAQARDVGEREAVRAHEVRLDEPDGERGMSASARRCARMRCVLTSLTASETRLQSRAVGAQARDVGEREAVRAHEVRLDEPDGE